MQNNFLAKIWGDAEGYRCVVVGKSMRHIFFEDNSHLGNHKDKDQWFAPSILKSQERKIENVVSTKAFWLDIDCGPGKAYETQHEAAFELKRFIDETGLPLSSAVVSSGNGLHVYWILTEYLSPAKWTPIAQALRQACVDLNLKADHSITIDIARILRVPGTKNYKDPKNPKPVEVLNENEPCSIQEIEEALADYIFKAELAEKAKEANKNFAIEFTQTPKDADAIAKSCAQVGAFRKSGDLPQPVWYAGVGVLTHCIDGREIAHKWSANNYPKYSKRHTDAKFDQQSNFGPTTCQKFYEVNPDLCKACPYFGKISSPVQLGESVTPLEVEKPQVQGIYTLNDKPAEKQETAIVPKPYLCGKEGVFLYKPATDTEGPEKQFIASHPIWVSRVMVGEDGSGSEIELSWINAEGRNRTANLRQSLIETPAQFGAALRDRNIHFYGNLREFIYYISRCIDHVTRKQKEETVYSKFGFIEGDAGFLIGRDLITKDGIKHAHISSRINAKRVGQMDARGNLQGWKRAGAMLDKPDFWPHRFAIVACLGTPLLRISGNEGSVLSLAGETSGGKTTAANVGIAAFADPRAFTIDPTSTVKAFYEHWRQAGNLPIVINEASTIRHDQLNNMILTAANGKARDALTQSREMYDSGTWDTLTILTSNTQLLELPDSVISDAAKRRVLEIPFLPENCLPLSIGRPVNALIEKNHGHAGRQLVQAVLSESEYIGQRINERVEKLQDGIHSVHRYNLWLIAAASVAAEIAEGLGLIDFDTTDCIANTLDILKTNVRETLTPRDQVEALIAQYTQKFQGGIGHKEGSNNGWHREPVGSAMGRVTTQKDQIGELALPIRQFKEFALENGVDLNRVRKYMTKTKLVRLSRVGNGVECWILPWEGEE